MNCCKFSHMTSVPAKLCFLFNFVFTVYILLIHCSVLYASFLLFLFIFLDDCMWASVIKVGCIRWEFIFFKIKCKSQLTNSMRQSPFWEDNSYLAGRQTIHPVWNPKVHCCVLSVTTWVRCVPTNCSTCSFLQPSVVSFPLVSNIIPAHVSLTPLVCVLFPSLDRSHFTPLQHNITRLEIRIF